MFDLTVGGRFVIDRRLIARGLHKSSHKHIMKFLRLISLSIPIVYDTYELEAIMSNMLQNKFTVHRLVARVHDILLVISSNLSAPTFV